MAPDSADTDDAVRARAYHMREADGRPDGRADHYWHLAKAEAAPPARPKASPAGRRSPETAQIAAMALISTLRPGSASRASTVARAGRLAVSTQAS